MLESMEYGLFISPAWQYNEDYIRLVEMLDSENNFNWVNFSVPEYNPILASNNQNTNEKFLKTLDRQIRPASCILIISGMFENYSYWIQTEVDIAIKLGKPIIGIKPLEHQQIPLAISNVAKEMVDWNLNNIVIAIRKYSILY